VIGDELGRLRNPVLRRRMFTTPTDRQMMARGMPSGILNSGSEIANAATRPSPLLFGKPLKVSTQPDLGTRRGGTGTAGNLPDIIATNPGLAAANTDPSKRGDRKDRRDAITNPDDDTENQSPTVTVTPESSTSLPKSKTEPPASGGDKKTPKSEIDRFLELTGKRRGSTGKTRKENFADAKDFLAEVGVTEAKDVRTDRDMLMMIGGLKLAMGYGTGSGSQDAVKALNDVLGIYVGGKEAEREDQKAINLAAAKRAFDLEDAETARLAKLDEIELEAIAENMKQPEKVKIARELIADAKARGEELSLTQALSMANSRTSATKFEIFLGELKESYKGADPGFLALVAGQAGFVRQYIEENGMDAFLRALGVDSLSPGQLAALEGAPAATQESTTTPDGMTITPVN